MTLSKLLDIMIPRFITEDVAVERRVCDDCCEEHYEIACSMLDIEPGERFDGIATMRGFNLFGMLLFPRQVGVVRPWVNPWDGVSV